ncbi:glycosyltransferase [Pectobacterium carotovorum]|uniref:glycosyltransferase n=1 Tax=Pectobacterium carotovorum TaxID=554 RepID=UPI0032EC213D
MNPKTHLILLNAFDVGGIERASFSLMQSFTEYGLNVELLSLRPSNKGKPLSSAFSPVIIDKNNKGDFWALYEYSKNLNDRITVISTYDRISIMLAFIFFLLKKKNVLISHQHADYFAHRKLIRGIRRLCYGRVNNVLALTQKDHAFYASWHKCVNVLPNILIYPKYLPEKRWKDREIDIIAVGRLNVIKRFEHFIKLSNSLISKGIVKNCKLYGCGEEEENIINLQRFEILAGRSDNVFEHMRNAKILVVTSYRESFSMVILEAMSQGCIVISYDCPTGPGELIQDRVNGFLVENGNVLKLEEKCEEVINNYDNLYHIMKSAVETAKKYSTDEIMPKWVNLLNC